MYFKKIARKNHTEASCFTWCHNTPSYDIIGKEARNWYVICLIGKLMKIWLYERANHVIKRSLQYLSSSLYIKLITSVQVCAGMISTQEPYVQVANTTLSTTYQRLSLASIAHSGKGDFIVATSDGQISSAIHCYQVTVTLQNGKAVNRHQTPPYPFPPSLVHFGKGDFIVATSDGQISSAIHCYQVTVSLQNGKTINCNYPPPPTHTSSSIPGGEIWAYLEMSWFWKETAISTYMYCERLNTCDMNFCGFHGQFYQQIPEPIKKLFLYAKWRKVS